MKEEQVRISEKVQTDLVFRIEMDDDILSVENFLLDLLERNELSKVDLAKAIQTVKARRNHSPNLFGSSSEKKDFIEDEPIRLDAFVQAIVAGRYRGKTPAEMLNSAKSQIHQGWVLAAAGDKFLSEHPNILTYAPNRAESPPLVNEKQEEKPSARAALDQSNLSRKLPEPIPMPRTPMDWAKQASFESPKVEKEHQQCVQRSSFRMR